LTPLGGWDRTIRAPTLASVIARRLEDEIVERGWPVGEVLGSESDFLERFGVSRAVFREAVRVVEHTGAARMRRGPGGGLVVTEPDRRAVVTAMSVWFSYVAVTTVEMVEARQVILEGACILAAGRRDRRRRGGFALDALDRLEESGTPDGSAVPDVEHLAAMEGTIAGMAANPALALFVDAVGDLGVSRIRSGKARISPRLTKGEVRARLTGYRSVIEAVSAGDSELAASTIRNLGLLVRLRVAEAKPTRAGQPGSLSALATDSSNKMAETVAGLMVDYIEELEWPVGEVLGSETELIEQFGVSRAILREAVRVLEHQGVVETKRGPRGGILVRRPDSSAIVSSARMFLEYEGVTPRNLSETRSVIEEASARLAAERGDRELRVSLLDALEREALAGDAAVSFGAIHHAIAAGTGNRLLALFVDVMGELVPPHLRSRWQGPAVEAEISAQVHRAHQRLVDAILQGDPGKAASRMRRHMLASADDFT
jgi:DNA-binding FadR family transcriptional regulator